MSDYIMGIDASTSCTGISIFKGKELVEWFEISSTKTEWHERLKEQKVEIDKVFNKYKPSKVWMEDVPLERKSLKNLVILGAVQGFIYCMCVDHGTEINYVSPNTWRSGLNMYDGTQEGKKRDVLKEKAVKMANNKFGLNLVWNGARSKKTQDDVAEAILIGWYGINIKIRSLSKSKRIE